MAVLDTAGAPAQLSPRADLGVAGWRMVDATLRCIARWGVAKTTLDDVAREAGYSRATVYRAFPGGKDALLEAVVRVERARFYARLIARLDDAASLEDLLVGGITEAVSSLKSHDSLQYLLVHEPEAILPRLAFAQMNVVLRDVAEVVSPSLSRWLPAEEALRAAEWVTRIVVSYTCSPSDSVDMTDPASVRALVRSFVLPALLRSAAEQPSTT